MWFYQTKEKKYCWLEDNLNLIAHSCSQHKLGKRNCNFRSNLLSLSNGYILRTEVNSFFIKNSQKGNTKGEVILSSKDTTVQVK